jgi:uncharacterized protein YkwD
MSSRYFPALCLGLAFNSSVLAQTSSEDDRQVPRSVSGTAKQEKSADVAEAAKQIFDATNRFRREEGLTELKENPQLTEAARYFASFMASNDKYGHDADGKQPADRAKEYKYDYCALAENIAYEYSSAGFETKELAKGLFEGWKKSPGHRKNMLDPDVTEVGMAVGRSEKSGKYYGVQMFGRPRSAAIEFQVVNEAGEDVKYQVGDETLTLGPRYTRTHQDCRPGEIKFAWSESEGKAETFRPGPGDRFVITKKDGKLRVTREESRADGSAPAAGK